MRSSSTPSFVSQAGNFTSAVAGQVDPRTGLFGANITLGKIIGNRGLGPVLPIVASYSPMATLQGGQGQVVGLGAGISFNFSVYQPNVEQNYGLLLLSTGERYVVSGDDLSQRGRSTNTDGGTSLSLNQTMLRNVLFERFDSGECNFHSQLGPITSCYMVTHKSGDIEILMGPDTGGTAKLPLLMVSAAGHALTFFWTEENGIPKLEKITDDTGVTLVSGDYDTDTVSFNFFPNQPKEKYVVELTYGEVHQNERFLTKVDVSNAQTPLEWKLEYKPAGDIVDGEPYWGYWLDKVTAPGGMTETVEYRWGDDGAFFPPSANLNSLPRVYTHTQDPGAGQPEITSTFTYTSNNFVAGGSDVVWSNVLDNLYVVDSAYAYGSTEVCGDRSTVRVYDKFHLQTGETVTQGSDAQKTVINETTYYDNDYYQGSFGNTPPQGLPAYFQCPMKEKTTWVDGTDRTNDPSYSETSLYTWDDWGNPISRTEPNGLFVSWEYYDGSQATYDTKGDLLCPADPNGFTRFAKWMCVDPTGVKQTDWMTPHGPVQQTNYTYDNAIPVQWNGDSYVVNGLVVKTGESHASGDAASTEAGWNATSAPSFVVAEATYAYDTVGGIDAGRLITHSLLHYPKGKRSSSNDYYQTDTIYTYTAETVASVDGLTACHTQTVYDPDVKATTDGHPAGYLRTVQSKTASVSTGRVLAERSTLNNVTTYTYDGLGRLTQRVLNAPNGDADYDQSYQNVFTYSYAIDDSGSKPFQVVQTDAKGNCIRYTMDGLHRLLLKEINAIDIPDAQDWYAMESRAYDAMGRLSQQTSKDHSVDPANDVTSTYSLSKAIEYDGWGQSCLERFSDGTVDATAYDPVGKTVSTTRYGTADGETVYTGTYVTAFDYNFSQKAVRSDRYFASDGFPVREGSDPYSSRSRQYNGLYWVENETDELGQVTSHQYDAWGRVVQNSLPDGTVVTKTYSEKSPAKWVDSIQVKGLLTGNGAPFTDTCEVGTRTFDGLGRTTSKTVGGCTWTYQYAWNETVQDGYRKPSTTVAPDGVHWNYVYIDALDEAVEQMTVGEETFGYTYEHGTGLMQTARAQRQGARDDTVSAIGLTPFYPSGRLQNEAFVYGGDLPPCSDAARATSAAQETGYTYTVGGALLTYTHIDGAITTLSRDEYGRIDGVSDEKISVLPSYDAAGRLTGWTSEAKNASGNYTFDTKLKLDDFSRETSRQSGDGTNDWTITQDRWQANDLLKRRTTQFNNASLRSETFDYDARNRLVTWQADSSGSALPSDRYGNTLTKQAFTLDALNNITKVQSAFLNGGENTTSFNFDYTTDPCRVLGGTHTDSSYEPSTFSVKYDAAGRILDDGMGTTLHYDSLGRVDGATSTPNSAGKGGTGLSGAYTYDPFHRLGTQTWGAIGQTMDQSTSFYYRAQELVNLIQDDSPVRLVRSLSGEPVAQYNSGGSDPGGWLLGCDHLGSVLSASNDAKSTPQQRAYSAYGEEPIVADTTNKG